MEKKRSRVLVLAGFYMIVGIMLMYYIAWKRDGNIPVSEFDIVSLTGEFKEEPGTRPEPETEPETGGEEPETEPEEKKYDFITTNKYTVLYVRSAPSMSGRIIGRLKPASRGQVIERGEGWSLITDGKVEGYSCNCYLNIVERE